MGRPRTVCPEDDELEILGKELVEWATRKDNPKDRVHLKQWYCLEKGLTKKHWDKMCEKEIFRAYYEVAQSAIAMRYITGVVNPSIAQRFMRLYFPELKKDEDDLVVMKAEISKSKKEESQEEQARKIVEAIKESEK